MAFMQTKLRTTFLACALAAAALAPAPAAALTFLADENPPFNFTEKGALAGAATEIVLQMASRASVPVRTEVLPWNKAYVRAQGQRDACLYSTARLENRERLFLWVGPIAIEPVGGVRQEPTSRCRSAA